MKKIGLILSIIFCVSSMITGCNKQQDKIEEVNKSNIILADEEKYYGNTFGQGDIVDVKVEIDEDDWADILANPTEEEFHSANITVNGTEVENVGFRTKGFSSLTTVAQSDSNRYGFKIKTDKYEDKQTLNGLNEFVLNGSFADPSYMREYLTYSAMKVLDGITPFATYANLYINNELFGFYLLIESYDDSFVERYSNAEDTCLYKAKSDFCTLLPSDDGSGFDLQYGSDKNLDNIKSLIEVLNTTTSETKTELEKILDVDSVLKAMAVNTVMGNYDSYSGSKAHNYYLLYSNGKFSYIGWDYNMSMGGFNEDSGASVTVDINTPVYGVDISQRPLIEKLLNIDDYKSKYLEYVNTLCDYFSNAEIYVEELADYIREDVTNDPTAFYSIEEFESNIVKSDTDLTQVENRNPSQGMVKPEISDNGEVSMPFPEGEELPNRDQMPEIPEGMEPPNMGENETQTSGENSQVDQGQGGIMPPKGEENEQMPEVGEPSSNNGEPVMPGNGQQMPPNNKGNIGKPGGGMGMISGNVVSIVDYITQRIDQIKLQLGS